MKFILIFSVCWIAKVGFAQCPVCDSLNHEFTPPQAPKEWLELIKDPDKIDMRKFEYAGRFDIELTISKEGKITDYKYFNPRNINYSDSEAINKIINKSASWLPATLCNYTFERKVAVSINGHPIPSLEDIGCRMSMIYLSPKFPGGLTEWHRFLQKHIPRTIALSPTATSKFCKNAIVEFLIDKDGSLTKINILNEKYLYPLQINAINKLMLLPLKWIPGEMSGRKVSGTFIDIIQFEFINVPFT